MQTKQNKTKQKPIHVDRFFKLWKIKDKKKNPERSQRGKKTTFSTEEQSKNYIQFHLRTMQARTLD